jgi:hypothetical protein
MELGSAYGKVVLDGSGVRKGITDIKSAFRDGARAADSFGNELSSGIAKGGAAVKNEAGRMVQGLKQSLTPDIGMALGVGIGGAIATGLGSVIPVLIDKLKQFTETGVQLGKMAQQTGMAAKDLSALAHIAKEGEIDVNQLNVALTRYARVLGDTVGPTANMKEELFRLSDQFKTMPDGALKTEMAMAAFGRGGAALIPILNQGGEALRAYAAELDAAGVLMDDRMVAAANRMDDAMDRAGRTSERLTVIIGSNLVPVLADLAEGIDFVANQSFQNLAFRGDLVNQVLVRAQIAGLQAASGANAAAAGFNNAGNAAAGAIGEVNALANAFGNAQVAYGAARRASDANQRWMNSQAATSAKLAERESKDFDRAEQQRMKIQQYNKSAAQSTRDVERESAKLGRTLTYSTKATWDANAAVGDYTKSLGGGGGGGGAAGATDALAKTTDALADAQERLNARTASIEGAMSSSLKPMSDMDKFQQAWAIATGKTTIQELEQEAAVKSVMKALEDKKISQEDALATLVALRQGLLDAKDAMSQTGGSGDQFLKDVESIRTLTDGAIKKVEDLGIGVNNLPNNKDVRIGIRVVGKEDVMDAHDRMAAMRDRDITLRVNVVGLQDLKDIGAGLRPVGTPGGFAPGSTTTTPAPSPGVTTTTPATPLDDGAKRGTQSVTNVNVGGELVATVMTDSQGGVNVMRSNKRRSWRA